MNTSIGWLSGHPESGELLCFADRGMGAAEQERLAAHLVDCEHCQHELAGIESLAHSAAAALGAIPYAPVSDIRRARAWKAVALASRAADRKRAFGSTWLPRVAAASLLVISAAAASGPALAMVRSLLAPDSRAVLAVAPVVVLPLVEDVEMSGGVSVDWSLPNFVMGFSQVGDGTVEFSRANGLRVSVRVIGAPSHIENGRSGLLIHNAEGLSPRYLITLPRLVAQVMLSVSGAEPVTFAPESGVRYDLRSLAAGKLVVKDGR